MNRAEVLLRGMRAARTGRSRRLVAGALLFLAVLLYLLLLLFPGPVRAADPRRLLSSLTGAPRLFALYLVSAGVLGWCVLSFVLGAVLRDATFEIAGRPVPSGEALEFSRRKWGRLFFAPLAAILPAALFLLLAALFLSLVRIPWVGWPLVVLASPIVLVLAGAGAANVFRALLAWHLVLPGMAAEDLSPFVATSRAFAWLRRRPLSVLLSRVSGFGLVAVRSVIDLAAPVAGLSAAVLFLGCMPGRPLAPVARTLREGFGSVGAAADLATGCALLAGLVLAAWYAAVPLLNRLGAGASLFFLHRLELDGTEFSAPLPEAVAPGKTLEELGIELVERIGRD